MNKAVRIVSLLLAVLLLFGCAPQGGNTETTAPVSTGAALESEQAAKTEAALAEIAKLGVSPDDNYRTFYEIFVYSFCDSDGDGIGDLQGVISKLDYLQELGINGIWFMPIHPSQSYHKYDVRDYYDIDPQYGTLTDFETFMAECRKRDIHVILDLVLNHTGDDNAWFLTAAEYLKNLPAIDIVASGLHDTIGLYRRTLPEQQEMCRWWMNIFNIAHLAERDFLTLSSGEQRLCLLARAFVKDPQLLILDEPLHGLDNRNGQMVKDIINTFCRRPGKTLIMVSHYEEELPSCITHRLHLKKHS